MTRMLNNLKNLSRRTVSIVSAVSICLTMILAVVSGVVFVSFAGNPGAVEALNQEVPVQYINLMPVSMDKTSYVDENEVEHKDIDSRTTYYSGDDKYVKYTFKSDSRAELRMNANKNKDTGSTSLNNYVRTITQLRQQINLQENPWLTVRYTATANFNGYLYVTFSKKGDLDNNGNIDTDEKGNPVFYTYGADGTMLTGDACYNRSNAHAISFAAIAAANDIEITSTGDLKSLKNRDYTVDAYRYMYDQFHSAAYWPNWEDGEYMTVVAVSHILASGYNQDLETGKYVEIYQCGLGKYVMSRPASILPRSTEAVDGKAFKNAAYSATNAEDEDARGAVLDDGRAVFRNASDDGWVELTWPVRRYVNVTALKSLYLDFEYESGTTGDDFELFVGLGGRGITTDPSGTFKGEYRYLWNNCYISSKQSSITGLIGDTNYSSTAGLGLSEKYRNSFLELYDYCKNIADVDKYKYNDENYNLSSGYKSFYPDDHLVFIGSLTLRLPPNAKLTMNEFHFQVKNDLVSSTTVDTAYPWVGTNEPDSDPPSGTPATSSALNNASGVAYAWVAEPKNMPTVATKTDLLALLDQETNFDLNEKINDAGNVNFLAYTGTTQTKTKFWRTVDGESYVRNVAGGVQSRNFRRSRGDVTSNESDNYYMDIDLNETPYLYYSYQITAIDSAEGKPVPKAGVYFSLLYNGTATKEYYLSSSGMSLFNANSDMTSAPSKMCSAASALTGCIDLRKILGANNASKFQWDTLKLYVSDNTNLRMTYMFLGSEALNASEVTNTIPFTEGTKYAWGVSGESFNMQTDSASSSATVMYANKFDILKHVEDAAEWNLKHTKEKVDPSLEDIYNKLGWDYDATVANNAVTVTIDADEKRKDVTLGAKRVGLSFDTILSLYNATGSDSAPAEALRYLNYSVTAPAGMRWSFIFVEAGEFATSAAGVQQTKQGAAMRAWEDRVTVGSNSHDLRDELIAQKDTAVTNAYDKYWKTFATHDSSTKVGEDSDKSATWYTYSVPGSESGCLDLADYDANMDWHDIIGVYLVAYKDPNMRSDDGAKAVSGSVQFNYMYFTSEPLNVGAKKPATVPGERYSWAASGAPDPGSNYNLLNNSSTAGYLYEELSDSVQYRITPINNIGDYNLFYSYELVPILENGVRKDKGKAPTAMLLAFSADEGEWKEYAFRTNKVGAIDHLYQFQYNTTSSKTCGSTGVHTTHGTLYPQFSESGCISLSSMGFNSIHAVKIFFDRSLYTIRVDYLFIAKNGGASTGISLPSEFVGSSAHTAYANFSDNRYTEPDDNVHLITNANTSGETFSPAKTIDLDVTPYLYYSIEYPKNVIGTFGLSTTTSADEGVSFFRDASLVGDQGLISAGTCTSDSQHMLQSETGCIDVKKWYQDNSHYPTDGIINVNSFTMWLSGASTAKVRYLYFGDKAETTVDLIPSEASGLLENGIDTRSWTIDNGGYASEAKPSTDAAKESYIQDSWVAKEGNTPRNPNASVKFVGDTNQDSFNSLKYQSGEWGFTSICYGELVSSKQYIHSGINCTSGLVINLNETPYLHFSISQAAGAYTTFLLQTDNYTSHESMRYMDAGEVKPWLSAYYKPSPAGQLMQIAPQTQYITYYKDTTISDTYASGEITGVIDLRAWYTETNGFDDIVVLERVRFYSTLVNNVATDITVNHFYLSSAAGAAYELSFDKNDNGESSATVSTNVLQNANQQFATDAVARAKNFHRRNGYTFMGWYEDRAWEQYYNLSTTPIIKDTQLYAGWLDNTMIDNGKEVGFLKYAGTHQSEITATGNGSFELTAERLCVEPSSNGEYTITVPVKKAYKINELRSLFIGFNTDKTCAPDDLTLSVNIKSQGTKTYEILGSDFGNAFYNDEGNLTAAAYDREIPLYTKMAQNDWLPVNEYVYVDSFKITVKNGVHAHLRYLKAAKATQTDEMTTVIAPPVKNNLTSENPVIDLLDPGEDKCFVEQEYRATYSYEIGATMGGDDHPYTKAQFSGVEVGYVTLGSMYGLGDEISGGSHLPIAEDSPYRYLYYHITQSENSLSTFGLYTGFRAEDGLLFGGGEYWYSFYDTKTGSFVSSKNLVNQSIPTSCFQSGTYFGRIDLYEYFKDILWVEQGVTRKITDYKFTSMRLYTHTAGTDATVDYMFLGGDYTDEKVKAQATYLANNDQTKTEIFVEDSFEGQGVTISLNDLKDSKYAFDPTKTFKGWSFDGTNLVYWNPNAENDRQYDASSNPKGAWTSNASIAQANNFVANLHQVSYQLNETTQYIYPLWDTADYRPNLTVNVEGNGSFNFDPEWDTAHPISGTDNQWTVSYGYPVVLTAGTGVFEGWYDQNDTLVSASRDVTVYMTQDTTLTAKFSNTNPMPILKDSLTNGRTSVVWLRAGDASLGKAGQSFYLEPENNGEILQLFTPKVSGIQSADKSDLICYWEIEDSQRLTAVAPTGYHWEMILSDGKTVSVSHSNRYTFVTAVDIQLVCVKNGNNTSSESDFNTIFMNDVGACYSLSYAGENNDKLLRQIFFTGQVTVGEKEEVVSCGVVLINRDERANLPSVMSADSNVYTANAWNSTTGQFTLEFSVLEGNRFYARPFAIVKLANGRYTIRYSDFVATIV